MQRITSPDDDSLGPLCELLREHAATLDASDAWPAEQLRACGEAGVFEWFLAEEHGGQGWSDVDVTRGYLAMSEACLTTTFVITQRTGACRRIALGDNDSLKERLLPDLLAGRSFATVGISHLTTSRRHLAKPVLSAERVDGGYRVDGYAPWVTGAPAAQRLVVGATLVEDGEATERQLLLAADTTDAGVTADEPFRMVALTASHTGAVRFDGVVVSDEDVVAGPVEDVMQGGVGARTGGPQTSTLALGAANASLRVLRDEADRRSDLVEAYEALAADHADVIADLLETAAGAPPCSSESLRKRANSLALRASQAALAATKGAGYLADAAAGRHCREALFFLVWSCPQPVQQAGLCELAGIAS